VQNVCQSMVLKLIGQFSSECIDCHTNIKFINSDWLIESIIQLTVVYCEYTSLLA